MLFRGVQVSAICDDSRRVTLGCLFVSLAAPDKGAAFIAEAVAQGAALVVLREVEALLWTEKCPHVLFVGVADPQAVLREIAAEFYGRPADQVRVVGVTGTNGKTTITYLLEAVLAAAGRACGVVGTVNCRAGGKIFPSRNTTPGFLDNQTFLKKLANEGISYSVMEVSSHALAQGRVDLIDFKGGIFTNLTGDHLDYHKTMELYFEAKSRLFRGLSSEAWAAVNIDDVWGRKLVGLTQARVLTYGIDAPASVHGRIVDMDFKGTRVEVSFPGGVFDLSTVFIGKHNIYNVLAVVAAGLGEGFSPEIISEGIASLKNVPGRLESVEVGQPFAVLIDYAHTDDGLKNVLQALRQVRHERLIVVFGCGGDRDRTKRSRMGAVAGALADWSIITSDNPRSEDPSRIIDDVTVGFSGNNYETIPDRKEAIHQALAMAQPGDIVLLAGKGHETSQVLRDGAVDFVERIIVERYLAKG